MVKRGQLWWAELSDPNRSEPGFNRPVLIVQADNFNQSNINTVIVIALTSNIKLVKAPGNVSIPKSKTGLGKDSVANVSRMITLDKESLTEVIGQVDRLTMYQIDEGIRLVLSV